MKFSKGAKITLVIVIVLVALAIAALFLFGKTSVDISAVVPYSEEYFQILKDPELVAEYQKTHAFLDDFAYIASYIDGFDLIGYSQMWDTLCLTFRNDETRYYTGLPKDVVDSFELSDFSMDYFRSQIEPYYSYSVPEDPNLDLQREYVKIR